MIQKSLAIINCYKYWHCNHMNEFSLSSEQHIHIWIGGITFTKLLVCWLGIIYITYDNELSLHDWLILVYTLKLKDQL
jgi:hypothetical protein